MGEGERGRERKREGERGREGWREGTGKRQEGTGKEREEGKKRGVKDKGERMAREQGSEMKRRDGLHHRFSSNCNSISECKYAHTIHHHPDKLKLHMPFEMDLQLIPQTSHNMCSVLMSAVGTSLYPCQNS